MAYKPSSPFTTALMLLVPEMIKAYGVPSKHFPSPSDGILFYGSFKTYGGTEREINGVNSIKDTAVIECWYRPDITSDCRIAIAGTNAVYDVIGEPEDIELRHQYLKFKVERIKGGA